MSVFYTFNSGFWWRYHNYISEYNLCCLYSRCLQSFISKSLVSKRKQWETICKCYLIKNQIRQSHTNCFKTISQQISLWIPFLRGSEPFSTPLPLPLRNPIIPINLQENPVSSRSCYKASQTHGLNFRHSFIKSDNCFHHCKKKRKQKLYIFPNLTQRA